MNLRFLILDTDYSEFIGWLYAQHPGLEKQPYDEQMRVRNESLFGVADFYSSNLRKLGHDACDVHANNEFMQKVWAAEHGISVKEPILVEERARTALQSARGMAAKTPLRYLIPFLGPILGVLGSKPTWFHEILVAQTKHYKPDILLNLAPDGIGGRFLRQVKPHVRLLAGQIAAPLPQDENWNVYDLMLSSLPNLVEHFRSLGVPCELLKLAFEPEVLSRLKGPSRNIPISFVGSLSSAHQGRARLLEHLCASLEIKVWGTGIDALR